MSYVNKCLKVIVYGINYKKFYLKSISQTHVEVIITQVSMQKLLFLIA